MHILRLTMLAGVLENLPVELPELKKFHLGVWGRKYECGYAGCAIGSAMLYKPFNDMGFGPATGDQWPRSDDTDSEGRSYTNIRPAFRGVGEGLAIIEEYDWEAVQKFFELTATQSYHLFYIDDYFRDIMVLIHSDHLKSPTPTAAEVAARIRAFIASGGEIPQ
jgi:hypothetical protein